MLFLLISYYIDNNAITGIGVAFAYLPRVFFPIALLFSFSQFTIGRIQHRSWLRYGYLGDVRISLFPVTFAHLFSLLLLIRRVDRRISWDCISTYFLSLFLFDCASLSFRRTDWKNGSQNIDIRVSSYLPISGFRSFYSIVSLFSHSV